MFKEKHWPSDLTHCRPIRLYSRKGFGETYSNKLYNCLTKNNIFFSKQFGFWAGLSADHLILKLMDTVAISFIEIKYTPGAEESTAYHIVTCGALQGSIFRTLFFLIVVNSIHKVFDCINCYKILRD